MVTSLSAALGLNQLLSTVDIISSASDGGIRHEMDRECRYVRWSYDATNR